MNSTNYAIIRGTKYEGRSAALTAPGMTPERLLLMCSQSNPNSTTESIPYGYCHCGCGELAPVATYTRPEKGWVEGVPHKFRRGHNTRLKSFPRSKLFGAPRPKPRAVPVIDESGEFATIGLFSKKYPGRVAKIDVDDIPLVSEYRWQPNSGGYAQAHVAGKRGDNTRRTILMHRLLMGHPTSKHVDHINGDKLDNRRSNLRVVTAAQNSWNKKKEEWHH